MTKAIALCAKELPAAAVYNATSAASVGLLKLKSLKLKLQGLVAQAAVLRAGNGGHAIGVVLAEIEVDSDGNPKRADLMEALGEHFHFVQVGAEGAMWSCRARPRTRRRRWRS